MIFHWFLYIQYHVFDFDWKVTSFRSLKAKLIVAPLNSFQMTLTLNEPIYNVLCSHLRTTISKHELKTYPTWKLLMHAKQRTPNQKSCRVSVSYTVYLFQRVYIYIYIYIKFGQCLYFWLAPTVRLFC
jgi:hypothetical protein